MSKKHNQLINFLSNQEQEYIPAVQIAEALGVTDRTIRNYIKEINEKSNQISIVSSSEGYKLQTDDVSMLMVNETELEETLLDFEIVQFLMTRDDYTTYDEIADKFFYSPQTIRSRIQKLTMNMEKMGIDVAIDTKVFKGIMLVGTEIQKRVLLENLFTSISVKKEVYQDFLTQNFSNWVQEDVIESILNLVEEINIKFNLNLEFLMYKKISVQLVIMISRIESGNHVAIELSEEMDFKDFKEFEVANAFCNGIHQYVIASESECIYLTNYLMSLHLDLEEPGVENKDLQTVKKIEQILWNIEQAYQVPTYSQKKFKSNILNHIYRIIYPVSHNLLIYNPFVKETKSEYFFSFSIASNIALKIEKEFNVEIHDSEIAYLAYHIQNIFEAQDKKRIKTIILYSRNYERTKLLSSKIATYFNELEIYKIEKCSQDYAFHENCLYIGIDLAFTPETEKDIIMIQNGLHNGEIKKIRFFLESQNSIIERANIFWINENNPEQAIQHLLQSNQREQFIEAVMKREKMSYTSIGNLVAIPHPYFEMQEYKEEVIIGINQKAMEWGNEFVQLIIIYLPSDDVERNEYIFTEFFQKTKNIKDVVKLVQMETKEDFIHCWNQI
ncbi:BglG family transcription antiterminator [Oceanobacillus neutriphilus]|uniref:Transcriptional antiterminator n=1 Tax=Oceanobacillus neutriphilus TaxID=531815 RepID=A0ABQ2NTC6_9BACI|nr:PRD domain-containing protein [Oceanobacillus neutriphilus]GGP10069.1 transcriptional antiterminator [Oceanobacillus neutriphilus]